MSDLEPPPRDRDGRAGPAERDDASLEDARAADGGPESSGSGSPQVERPARPHRAASPVLAALGELDALPGLELAEHPAVYERINGVLHDALSAIDDA